MIETLLATIGVFMSPLLTESLTMPGGLVGALLLGKIATLGIIVIVTVITNIIRALRYCRDAKDEFESTGIAWGIKKGLLCGGIATIASIIISFIPILRAPFTIISFIPGAGSMVEGLILAVFYLLSYVMIAYPIWGVC
jgi:hypothetical protein